MGLEPFDDFGRGGGQDGRVAERVERNAGLGRVGDGAVEEGGDTGDALLRGGPGRVMVRRGGRDLGGEGIDLPLAPGQQGAQGVALGVGRRVGERGLDLGGGRALEQELRHGDLRRDLSRQAIPDRPVHSQPKRLSRSPSPCRKRSPISVRQRMLGANTLRARSAASAWAASTVGAAPVTHIT